MCLVDAGFLQLSYDGPYPVMLRKEKYFGALITGKSQVIGVDRFKHAFIVPSPLVKDLTEKTVVSLWLYKWNFKRHKSKRKVTFQN